MTTPGAIVSASEEFERWETVWQGGQRTGAIRRVWQYAVLLTRVALEADGGANLSESRIRFVPGPDWDLSWFRSTGMDEPALLRHPGSGHPGAGTLPGYGEFLVLHHLASTGKTEASWTALRDDDGGAPEATRVSGTPDPAPPAYVLQLLDPARDTAPVLRYDRVVGDRLRASHWACGGRILASDWRGSHAVLVPGDPGTAAWESLDGLDTAAADFLLHGWPRH